jgi:hypothetical protein
MDDCPPWVICKLQASALSIFVFAACPGLSGCFLNDEISMARGDIRVIGEVGFGRLEWYLFRKSISDLRYR